MAIDIVFTNAAVQEAAAIRGSHKTARDCEELADFACLALGEMGVESASVDLIYGPERWARIGSVRVPLLIATGEDRFVIKRYDCNDAARERDILASVGGVIAPRVRFFGDAFYAEDFIDPAANTALDRIADTGPDGLDTAIVQGGRMYAALARMRIDYHHEHWLDEFSVGGMGEMITDFGSARKFLTDVRRKNERVAMSEIDHLSADAYLAKHRPIRFFDMDTSRYAETRDALWSLAPPGKTLWNLLEVVGEASEGIARYVRTIKGRKEVGIAHWRPSDVPADAHAYAMELFPDFVGAFAQAYLTR